MLEKVNLITLFEIAGKVLWTHLTTSVCGLGKLDVCSWNWLGLNNNSLLETANFAIMKETSWTGLKNFHFHFQALYLQFILCIHCLLCIWHCVLFYNLYYLHCIICVVVLINGTALYDVVCNIPGSYRQFCGWQ